jgi:hypothetical protein
MKALHIDFVPRTHWRTVWLATAMAIMALAAITLPTYWKAYQNQRSLDQSILLLRQQPVAAVQALKVPIDARLANTRQAADLLQRDLNGVFTLLESIKEPNVRLRNLSLDSATGTARLEYEVDSIPRASSVTVTLNAGYAQAPWQLESINATSAGPTPQAGLPFSQSSTAPTSGQYRAQWRVDIKNL